MRLRASNILIAAVYGLSLASGLFAQTNPPARPRVGDLKEEQRLIDNAYLGDAVFQVKRARERLGAGNQRLAQQSGLWALEQIAYAKRRLERHAPRIEEAGGAFFERTSEATRKELRESYAKVRENYSNVEDQLDVLAENLKKSGLPILSETLNRVRSASGDNAVKAVNDGFLKAGETGKGDTHGGETVAAGTGGIGGANVSVGGANGVGTELTNAQGTRLVQTKDGVLVIPPGILIPGAKLVPPGKIVLANGQEVSIDSIKPGPNNTLAFIDPASGRAMAIDPATGLPMASGVAPYSGLTPPNIGAVDQNGRKITVGPEWKNGEQSGVTKDYIDMAGGMLESEIKVTRKIVDATSNPWKIQETAGDRRTWNFTIRVSDEKKAGGSISYRLTVDGGGPPGFTIKSWEVVDASGGRAAVVTEAGKPEAVATFTKGGKYDSFALGETDWGTSFKVKGPVIDAYP